MAGLIALRGLNTTQLEALAPRLWAVAAQDVSPNARAAALRTLALLPPSWLALHHAQIAALMPPRFEPDSWEVQRAPHRTRADDPN